MNTKRILTVAFALCVLVCTAIAVCAAVLTRRFDSLEHARAAVQLQQGLQLLDGQMSQLAHWTRELAQSAPTTTAATIRVLANSRTDVLALFDAQGREIQSMEIDRTHGSMTALSPALRSQLLQLWSDRLQRGAGAQQGWLETRRGLLAVFALDLAPPADGTNTLFAGRYLDAQLSGASFDIIALNDPARPAELQPQVAAWLHRGSAASTLLLDDAQTHRTTAHAMLKDLSGRPVALLRTASAGDISLAGRRTTWLLMGTLALTLGVGSFVLMIIILRSQHGGAAGSGAGQSALRQVQESIALVDAAGTFIDANDALLQILDYEREDLELLSLRGIYLDLPETLANTSTASGAPIECRLRARDGRLIDAELTLSPVSDAGRTLLCIVGRDISQRKQAEQSLAESTSLFEHLCTHDSLTDLPNRTYLQTHLPILLQEVADASRLLAVLYLDLDGFKACNDARGDGSGDTLLKLVAQRLRSELAQDQLLIRMEGDEFVVVAPLLEARAIETLAVRLLELIRKPFALADAEALLTASIGVAIYPQHGLDGDTLLKHADIALYQAKQQGRNGYRLFADDMNLQRSEHVILEQALRRAIDTDQIQLEYQPVVDLHTGLVTSFEALARWRHPQLGSVPPERFIPVAEHSRLILPLGEQIVRLAVLQLHDWQAAGLSLVPVAINVTALQLELTELAAHVQDLAQRYQVDLKWLAFEVTESVWLQDASRHIATLQQLRAAGARIYVDHCSARLADPEKLDGLPVDALKLDQRLIRDTLTGAAGVKTATDMLTLAGRLRLMTVAEGVESGEEAEQLRQLGCQCGQGYYFSKPIAPLQCRSLLQHMGEARRMTETVKIRAFRINRAAVTVE